MTITKRGLRAEFAKTEREAAAAARAAESDAVDRMFASTDKRLTDLADNLEEKVKGRIENSKSEEGGLAYDTFHKKSPFAYFYLPEFFTDAAAIKAMPGYKKLHEACKRGDVMIDTDFWQAAGVVIRIDYKKPYKNSPDAKKMNKKASAEKAPSA